MPGRPGRCVTEDLRSVFNLVSTCCLSRCVLYTRMHMVAGSTAVAPSCCMLELSWPPILHACARACASAETYLGCRIGRVRHDPHKWSASSCQKGRTPAQFRACLLGGCCCCAVRLATPRLPRAARPVPSLATWPGGERCRCRKAPIHASRCAASSWGLVLLTAPRIRARPPSHRQCASTWQGHGRYALLAGMPALHPKANAPGQVPWQSTQMDNVRVGSRNVTRGHSSWWPSDHASTGCLA